MGKLLLDRRIISCGKLLASKDRPIELGTSVGLSISRFDCVCYESIIRSSYNLGLQLRRALGEHCGGTLRYSNRRNETICRGSWMEARKT